MHNEQATELKLKRGVFNPLILFNGAVFCLSMALAPRAQSPSLLSGDPVVDFFHIRDFGDVFYVVARYITRMRYSSADRLLKLNKMFARQDGPRPMQWLCC